VRPLAEMFADAGGMVQLSREQARGRAGDFEIIEYILRGHPGGVPGTWGHHFDDYARLRRWLSSYRGVGRCAGRDEMR
jgi:hypothetical protein